MNKEKQIEEMAKDLLNVSKKVSNIIMEETHEFLSQNHKYNNLKDFHEAHKKGRNVMEAEFLVELGYAKASEVASKIFAEIERFLYMHFRFCKEEIGNDDTEYVKGRLELNTQIQNLIAEFKKKYTESEKDE
jgi:hypothetical protein